MFTCVFYWKSAANITYKSKSRAYRKWDYKVESEAPETKC